MSVWQHISYLWIAMAVVCLAVALLCRMIRREAGTMARIDKMIADTHRVAMESAQRTDAQLARIERLLIHLVRVTRSEVFTNMATKDTLDRLVADVQANTNATAAAKQALTTFAQTNADLTAKLQEALTNDDEAAVKAAADALEQNNADLLAAVPAVATAVTDGTPAAGDVSL